MEDCTSCEFCEVTADGDLVCLLSGERTHGGEWCTDWQGRNDG